MVSAAHDALNIDTTLNSKITAHTTAAIQYGQSGISIMTEPAITVIIRAVLLIVTSGRFKNRFSRFSDLKAVNAQIRLVTKEMTMNTNEIQNLES